MRLEIPFAGSSYLGRSGKVNPARTVNLYPQVEVAGSKSLVTLYSDPGLKVLGSFGSGPVRSHGIDFKGKLYFVTGDRLVSVTGGGTVSSVGALNTAVGRCTLAAGRSHLMVVDGVNGYTWDGSTFAQIADADFPNGATHVAYLDSYFIANKDEKYYISSPDDPTSWAALDFASAEAARDTLKALVTTRTDLYLAGDYTVEVHTNTGNADFPFERYANGTIQVGIAAPYSMAASAAGVFWLARSEEGDVFVARAAGLSAEPVSDPYIAWRLNKLSTVNDAIGWVYRQNGRWQYQLTFPTAGATLVYSIADKLWHERVSPGKSTHRAGGYGFLSASNQHVVGDLYSSKFYELDFDTYTDDGKTIERRRITGPVHKNDLELAWHELVIDIEAGVGNSASSDPKVLLRFSDDGAKTWSDWLQGRIGKVGEYRNRVVFHKLGVSRQRVFELKVTEPVPVTIIGAYAEVSAGRE